MFTTTESSIRKISVWPKQTHAIDKTFMTFRLCKQSFLSSYSTLNTFLTFEYKEKDHKTFPIFDSFFTSKLSTKDVSSGSSASEFIAWFSFGFLRR